MPVDVTIHIQRKAPPDVGWASAGIDMACARRAIDGARTMPARAILEILVFSGRPDPRITLDGRLLARLTDDVARLAPSDAPRDDRALGYGGLRVSGVADGATVSISSGYVTVSRPGGPPVHRLDPGRRLERRWLGIAIDALPADQSALADYLRTLLPAER